MDRSKKVENQLALCFIAVVDVYVGFGCKYNY